VKTHSLAASHWQTNNIVLYQVHPTSVGFELTTSVVICTDCIGSRKSNYLTITTRTTPVRVWFVVRKFQWFREKECFFWHTLINMIKSLAMYWTFFTYNYILKSHVAIDNFVLNADMTIIYKYYGQWIVLHQTMIEHIEKPNLVWLFCMNLFYKGA
jgi:hypothetical protein